MKENYPEIYAWVPWFQELARKIDEGGEAYLIAQAKQVHWGKDNHALLQYGDENIDPFSFFYFLAHYLGIKGGGVVYDSVGKIFGIDSQNPFSEQNLKQNPIFYTLGRATSLLFHDGNNYNPDLLWKLFRQAVKPDVDRNDVEINTDDFAKALRIRSVAVKKLTQCLFLINPYYFMPINEVTFASHVTLKLPSFNNAKEKIRELNGWEYYKELLKKIRTAFPDRAVYEINTELYLMKQQNNEQIQNKVEDSNTEEPKNVGKQMKYPKHPLNQILYGPPGTGKTWNTVNYALAIIDRESVEQIEATGRRASLKKDKDDGYIKMVTFHQNFSYEDFIEGIRPILGDDSGDESSNLQYEMVDGVFKKIADRACEDPNNNYVLIIDEINRGNIAKIFGELITLIEESKRIGNEDETTVTLPYSSNNGDKNKAFGVPNNLYILGTMNTADRSIALLDTALRRRFNFIEMMPIPKHSLIEKDVEGVNCQELLAVMNKRITVLLDREHQIGHSYFIGVDSMKKLSHVFRNKIMPLLQEYFYDDWERIVLVLNDNGFITHAEIEKGLFRKVDEDLVDVERPIYKLIEAKNKEWKNPVNYQTIYASKQTQSDENDGE